jgi:hypothetical protein
MLNTATEFVADGLSNCYMLACLSVLTPTRLLRRDQAWFVSPLQGQSDYNHPGVALADRPTATRGFAADETGHDHIELVYGLDRWVLLPLSWSIVALTTLTYSGIHWRTLLR